MRKRLLSAALALCLILSAVPAALAADESSRAAGWLLRTFDFGVYDEAEWAVFALARAGELSGDLRESYPAEVSQELRDKQGVITRSKYTEYSRRAIALTALGAGVDDVGGYSLLEYLTDADKVSRQGINGTIFALIAFDCADYPVPDTDAAHPAAREYLIDLILTRELPGGGFSLGGEPDADVTAMALCALAPYCHLERVRQAVDRGVAVLASLKLPDGGYESYGEANCESAAQVVIALASLGIDPELDSRFAGLLDALLAFQNSDGGFAHLAGGPSNRMATEQALCALSAVERLRNGKNRLYDLTDAAQMPIPVFTDVDSHWCAEQITATGGYGIVREGTLFEPDRSALRGECVGALSKSLGWRLLEPLSTPTLSDLAPDRWFCPGVAAAASRGVVKGREAGLFDGMSPISREEMMTIVARAAEACGLDTAADCAVLEKFPDHGALAEWAVPSAAFCVETGLVGGRGSDLAPKGLITRAEIVTILSRLNALLGK